MFFMQQDLYKKENLLALCLGLIVFFSVFVTSHSFLDNAIAINIAELLFLALYIIVLREIPPVTRIIKNYRITSLLLFLWLISITYSLATSPLDLLSKPEAIARYIQTVTHIVTFVFLWDFLNRYSPSLNLTFHLIPISTIIIACSFFLTYFALSGFVTENGYEIEAISRGWFESPPFNSHIRHTGHQAIAALSLFCIYFINRSEFSIYAAVNYILLIALWAFLFWLGARGAIVSITFTMLFIWLALKARSIQNKYFIFSVFSAAIIGLLIAECLAVFPWNGIINAIQRSIEAETLNEFSNNRILLWKASWESIQGHFIFGLGPQGFYLMPNWFYGTQPHNIFIQFLLEWGVIGTILFLLLLVKAFWAGVKLNILNKTKIINQSTWASGAVISTLSIYSLISGTYYLPQPSLYLVIAFAVWISPPKVRAS